jgi:HlyD family secretion protein
LITAIHVREGQRVSAGTPLLQLDTQRADNQLAAAKAEWDAAQARLLKLQNGSRNEELRQAAARVQRLQAENTLAEQELARQRDLVARKLQSQSHLDRALAQAKQARARLSEAREQQQLLINGTRDEDLATALAQSQAAAARHALTKQALQELSVSATREGVVDALPWHRGERVSAGSPVVTLLDQHRPYISIYLPQWARDGLRPGDEIDLEVDTSDKSFKATVRYIATEASFTPYYALNAAERSRLVYLMEADLIGDAKLLPNGTPVQVLLQRQGPGDE